MDAASFHRAILDAFEAIVPLIPDGATRQAPGYRVFTCPSFPIPLANAVWVGRDDDDVLAALAAALDEVRAAGMPPRVVVCEDATPRAAAEARRLGLTSEDRTPGMVVEPRAVVRAERPGNVVLRRAGDDPTLVAVALDLTVRGFEIPREWMTSLYEASPHLAGLDMWVAFAGDAPVSTGIGLLLDDAVGVFNVATPPEHRRKGYGAAVTTAIVRAGFDRGATWAYLQPSTMGRRVYEALGFRSVTAHIVFEAPA